MKGDGNIYLIDNWESSDVLTLDPLFYASYELVAGVASNCESLLDSKVCVSHTLASRSTNSKINRLSTD